VKTILAAIAVAIGLFLTSAAPAQAVTPPAGTGTCRTVTSSPFVEGGTWLGLRCRPGDGTTAVAVLIVRPDYRVTYVQTSFFDGWLSRAQAARKANRIARLWESDPLALSVLRGM
jgi:hypothetical protein